MLLASLGRTLSACRELSSVQPACFSFPLLFLISRTVGAMARSSFLGHNVICSDSQRGWREKSGNCPSFISVFHLRAGAVPCLKPVEGISPSPKAGLGSQANMCFSFPAPVPSEPPCDRPIKEMILYVVLSLPGCPWTQQTHAGAQSKEIYCGLW